MATKPNTLASIRARNEALQREHGALQNAEPNRAETAADFESFCRGAAAAGDQRLAYHTATGNPADAFVLRCMPDGTVTVAPLLAALLGPDKLAAELCRHLPDGPGGPPAAERAERLAAVAAELFEAECVEERLIEASEAAGVPIARRADADPRAVLGVRDVMGDDTPPPPVFDAMPSTPRESMTMARSSSTPSKYMERKPA